VFEDTLVEEDIHPVYVSAGATHVGRVRTSNQDAHIEHGAAGLWAVADGMGGYRDGDVAARMVCEALGKLDASLAFEDAIDAIRQAMSDVNLQLHRASIRPVNPVMSGSTVAMLLTRRTSAALIWAGDSRVYRLRHGVLTQLTTDHTWAAELNLPPSNDEADHAITRAVGGEDTLLLDVRRERVRPGDRYLVCSDGLTRELNDAQIRSILAEGDAARCVDALLAAVLATAARDNVTAVIVDAD
jgi:serine/threonine protein phosphatase PrpC